MRISHSNPLLWSIFLALGKLNAQRPTPPDERPLPVAAHLPLEKSRPEHGAGKVFRQKCGARLKAPQMNAIAGFGDRDSGCLDPASGISKRELRQAIRYVSARQFETVFFLRRAAMISPTPDCEPDE
jgi:hypothetical protein